MNSEKTRNRNRPRVCTRLNHRPLPLGVFFDAQETRVIKAENEKIPGPEFLFSSQVQESKEKEERQQRDETLKQQRQLVEYLGEKLEKISMRIEEKEKTSSHEGEGEAVSPTPVFVTPCPICGHVGVHQHGARFFNGYNLVPMEHVVGAAQQQQQHQQQQQQQQTTRSQFLGVKDDLIRR